MAESTNGEPVKVKTKSQPSDDKVLSIVATIPLVGLILYYAMPTASPIVKNYAKQSNALLFLNIVGMIPLIGWIFWIVFLVFWVLLLVNALQENPSYKLPLVGEYFDKLLK